MMTVNRKYPIGIPTKNLLYSKVEKRKKRTKNENKEEIRKYENIQSDLI